MFDFSRESPYYDVRDSEITSVLYAFHGRIGQMRFRLLSELQGSVRVYRRGVLFQTWKCICGCL